MNKSIYIRNSFFIFYIALMIIAGGGCQNQKDASPAPTASPTDTRIAVQVVQPKSEKYVETLIFSGFTETPQIIPVSFVLSGKIQSMNFEVGDQVHRGDLLAEIDPKIYQSQVETARSNVGLAQANLNKVYAGARNEEIEIARLQALQAKIQYQQAEREYKRFKAVYEEDAVAKRDFDTVEDQFKLSKKQWETAEEQYRMTKKGATGEDKQIAGANVDVAKSNLNQAQVQMEYTTLNSPVDGIISRKFVETGTVVGGGNPVYEIRSQGGMDFIINVPSIHIDKFTIGMKGTVTFVDTPDEIFHAKVREIQPSADDMTRSFQIKLRLSGTPHGRRLTGTIGKATFKIGEEVTGAFVPISCIMKKQDDKGFYVYVINAQDTADVKYVQIVRIKDEQGMITGDISDTDRVVVSGQEYLNPGSKVRIVDMLNSRKLVSPDKDEDTGENRQKL